MKAAERTADIQKVENLERKLTEVHLESFPAATRTELPPPDAVDPQQIEERLRREAGIPSFLTALGGSDEPPTAPDPDPVDRYVLMREERKRGRRGIPIYALRRRITAAKEADARADKTATMMAEERADGQRQEQARLDSLWRELQEAQSQIAKRLPTEIRNAEDRRNEDRAAEQAKLDDVWRRLQANEPEVTLPQLEAAFADNESPSAPLDCQEDVISIVMQFPMPEELVPERKPALTPTGKPTLKKRNKTEIHELYRRSLASNVVATVHEAFAVAPGANVVQMLVIRREATENEADELAPIYVGEFSRDSLTAPSEVDLSQALLSASDAALAMTGRTGKITPLKLGQRPDLVDVMTRIREDLGTSD